MTRGPTVELLGHVRCGVDGREVPVPAGKPSLLLAVLALHADTVVTPSTVVDALWDDHPPSSARALVHTYVSTLRRALEVPGAPDVATEPGGYRLRIEPTRVDVLRLLAAVDSGAAADDRADLLERSGRPFLGGVEAPGLDPWQVRVATAREALRVAQWRQDLEQGRAARVLPGLQDAVRAEPLDEERSLLLARALGEVGRVGDALGVLDALRRSLATELGLDPSPRVHRLRQLLLEREVAHEAGAGPSLPTPAPLAAGPPPDGSGPSSSPVRRRTVVGWGAGLVVAAGAGTWALAARDDVPAVRGAALLGIGPEGAVVAVVDLPVEPREVVASGRRVWVTSATERAVAVVDWAARRARVVGLAQPPSGLAAAGDEAVVGLGFSGDVVAVGDGPVGASRPAVEGASGRMTLAAGPSGLWVATIDGALHVPPGTPGWASPVALGRVPVRLVVDGGRAWVLSGTPAELVAVDPGVSPRSSPVRGEPVDLVAGGGQAWAVTSGDDRVWHAATDGGVTGTQVLPGPPAGVALHAGRLWVVVSGPAALVAHDPQTLRRLSSTPLPRDPVGLVVVDGVLVVAVA